MDMREDLRITYESIVAAAADTNAAPETMVEIAKIGALAEIEGTLRDLVDLVKPGRADAGIDVETLQRGVARLGASVKELHQAYQAYDARLSAFEDALQQLITISSRQGEQIGQLAAHIPIPE